MRTKKETIFKWKQGKTYEYCLGVDLALRRSGVALLTKDYQFIMSNYFDTTHSVDNLVNLSDEVTTKFISILEPYKEELKDSEITIFVDCSMDTGYDAYKALAFGEDAV